MKRLSLAVALLLCAGAQGMTLGLRIAMWRGSSPPPPVVFDTSGYAGVYDGKGHGVSVAVSTPPSGARVRYALSENGPYSESAPLFTNVCDQTVWIEVSADDNAATTNSAKVAISRAPLSIAAEPKAKKQGEADPPLTYAVTGLIPGDDLSVQLQREPGESTGTYAITLKSAVASDNYELSFTASALTIQAVPPRTYKVAFYANAKGVQGKMSAQKMTYGKAAKLQKNAFTRKGYVFLGWAKSAKGAVAYKNTASVKNLMADGGTVKLYAVWAKKNYKVAFYANAKGVQGKMSAQKMTYGKAKRLSANQFKRKGYVFRGWATSKANAKKGKVAYKNKKSVKNLVKNGKTVKLFAVWKKK